MTITNNTFSKNIACYGGAICGDGPGANIVNSILWDDSCTSSGNEIYGYSSVTYSDVEGGWAGEGNISFDPCFRNPLAGDYHLSVSYCGDLETSPCIDRGISSIFDQSLDCDLGLGDTLSDMGAYGGGNAAWPTGIDDRPRPLPSHFALLQNYPNPFNTGTVFEFELSDDGEMCLSIYDITGAMVATLMEARLQAGPHSVIWNPGEISSGIYFARLRTAKGFFSRKMTLLR